jgi:phage I-like protein
MLDDDIRFDPAALRKIGLRQARASYIPIPEEPPTEFLMIPRGKNDSENGPYIFDDLSAKCVMQGVKKRGVRVPFDYHHSMLEKKPSSYEDAGKAAGWFTPEVRKDGLWATQITWTPAAIEHFRNKEYAYFSPAFLSDKSGRVVDLINCALTNTPATHDNEQLVAASRTFETEQQEENSAMTEEETKRFKALEEALESLSKKHDASESARKKLEEETAKLKKRMKKAPPPEEDDEDEDEEEEEARHEESEEEEECRSEEEESEEEEEEETEEEKRAKEKREKRAKEKREAEKRSRAEEQRIFPGSRMPLSKRFTRVQLERILKDQDRRIREQQSATDELVRQSHERLVREAVKNGKVFPHERKAAMEDPSFFRTLMRTRKNLTVAGHEFQPDDARSHERSRETQRASGGETKISEKDQRRIQKMERNLARSGVPMSDADKKALEQSIKDRPLGVDPHFTDSSDDE